MDDAWLRPWGDSRRDRGYETTRFGRALHQVVEKLVQAREALGPTRAATEMPMLPGQTIADYQRSVALWSQYDDQTARLLPLVRPDVRGAMSVPEPVAKRLASCLRPSAARLKPAQYAMSFNVHVTDKGKAVSAYIKESTLGERDIIYTVRKETTGPRPNGYQGLAKRWWEYATNEGKLGYTPEGKLGTKAINHLAEYGRHQERLKEKLKDWKTKECEDKDLPRNARQYAEQVPQLGPGKPLEPKPTPIYQPAATLPVTVPDGNKGSK